MTVAMSADADAAVIVVGSLNLDSRMRVTALPRPGETVLARDVTRSPGGKGVNQAIAAAGTGATCLMVGLVGDDIAASELLDLLLSSGVDVVYVGRTTDAPTGLAIVVVDESGENQIVVASGANSLLTGSWVRDALGRAADANRAVVVLANLEVPMEAVTVAAEIARDHGWRFVLNPAPSRELSAELLSMVDVLTPNALEAELLWGPPPAGSWLSASARALLRSTCEHGPGSIIVTLGSLGALLVDCETSIHVQAPAVDVVDSTGAGDALNGVIAAALCGGATLHDATRAGVYAGSMTAATAGATPFRLDHDALAGILVVEHSQTLNSSSEAPELAESGG